MDTDISAYIFDRQNEMRGRNKSQQLHHLNITEFERALSYLYDDAAVRHQYPSDTISVLIPMEPIYRRALSNLNCSRRYTNEIGILAEEIAEIDNMMHRASATSKHKVIIALPNVPMINNRNNDMDVICANINDLVLYINAVSGSNLTPMQSFKHDGESYDAFLQDIKSRAILIEDTAITDALFDKIIDAEIEFIRSMEPIEIYVRAALKYANKIRKIIRAMNNIGQPIITEYFMD